MTVTAKRVILSVKPCFLRRDAVALSCSREARPCLPCPATCPILVYTYTDPDRLPANPQETPTMHNLTLWRQLRLAPDANPSQVLEDACIVTQDQKIVWLGPLAALPPDYRQKTVMEQDLAGALVSAGRIGCQRQRGFGGRRARAVGLRLAGAS